MDDPLIRQLRDALSDNDLAILDAVNRRLALVQRLHAYKHSRGIAVVDPEREDWIVAYVSRANRGPLSEAAVHELFTSLIALTTQEAARLNEAGGQP